LSQGNPDSQDSAADVPILSLHAAQTRYVNFCRVAGTPEELVIDFGLNELTVNDADHPAVAHQRITLNYFTAKRLLQTLQVALSNSAAAVSRSAIWVSTPGTTGRPSWRPNSN
jgi:hypothetical protein